MYTHPNPTQHQTCDTCQATFVPEKPRQKKCTNCLLLEEIKARYSNHQKQKRTKTLTR